MTLTIDWHPGARAEFDADINWYGERDLGLSDRFEIDVLDTVHAVAVAPESWATWPGWDREPAVRSKGAVGFPYRVVYFVEGSLLTIVAVAHTRRRPGYWRDRVSP